MADITLINEFPDWTSNNIKLWEELESKPNKTDKEKQFCNWMYHLEEYKSGLDGDRDDN